MKLIDADELLDIYHHDADCDLYEALDITTTIQAVPTDVLDKIRAEIEKAMEDFYYDEHDLGVRAGFRFALEIIDNHISGKEQE